MYPTNEPFHVRRATAAVEELTRLLLGHGTGGILTPDAVTDPGTTLRTWLEGLKGTIDQFLSTEEVGIGEREHS